MFILNEKLLVVAISGVVNLGLVDWVIFVRYVIGANYEFSPWLGKIRVGVDNFCLRDCKISIYSD